MPHVKTLDSWRGLGALVVALHHFPGNGYLAQNGFVQNCHPLVDFFFTLSGFVIAANYLDRLNDRAAVGRYMWLRFARIYPLHIATFLAFFVFEATKAIATYAASGGFGDAFTQDKTLPQALAHVFMVHSLGLFNDVSWNRPAWSISCEMAVYTVFAFLTFFGGRKWRFPLYIAAGAASMFVLLRFSQSNFVPTADYGVFRAMAGFVSGVLCFQVWQMARVTKFFQELPDYVWTIVELVSFYVIIHFLSIANMTPVSYAAPFLYFAFTFIYSFQRGFISKLLQWHRLVYLGTISYSVYMTHQFIFDRALNVADVIQRVTGIQTMQMGDEGFMILGTSSLQADILFLVALLVVLGVSHMTYKWIEEYFRDKGRDVLKARRAKKAALAAATAGAMTPAPAPGTSGSASS